MTNEETLLGRTKMHWIVVNNAGHTLLGTVEDMRYTAESACEALLIPVVTATRGYLTICKSICMLLCVFGKLPFLSFGATARARSSLPRQFSGLFPCRSTCCTALQRQQQSLLRNLMQVCWRRSASRRRFWNLVVSEQIFQVII